MRNKCGGRTPALNYNLKANVGGKASTCLKEWPYARLQSCNALVVKKVHSQVDRIWKACEPERLRQDNMSACSSASDTEGLDSDLESWILETVAQTNREI